jgi:hypothetical protein
MEAAQLYAGVAERNLTPPLGLAMGDGALKATGHLTPIAVKALVLANEHTALAIVALDALGLDLADGRRAAALAAQRSGVPADSIIMTCSHTHVAPSTQTTLHTYRGFGHPEFDDAAKARERAWVDTLVETIADAVGEAYERRVPASFGVVRTELPWLVFNRRRETRDFGVWTHWMGIPKNQAYAAEGPIDPEFLLFVVRGPDHRPLALLWNFTGHNSFNFADKYSGDLTYTVQRELDERLGAHIPLLYAPGACGNTNYFDFGKPYGLEKATDEIASAIVATYREACTLPSVPLGSRKAELYLAQRDVTRYWWKDDIARKLPGWNEYGAVEVERFRAEAAESCTYQTELVVQRIGDVAFVGLPGEMFVEFGLMLKQRSPFRHTGVAIYANDYAGYVATREAYHGGSYEVWPVLNARVGREGGYLIVDKAVDLLHELYEA